MKEAGIKIIIDSEEAKRKFNELQGSFKELKKNRDEAFKAGNVDAFKSYDAELKKTGRELKKFEKDTVSVERTLLNLNKVSQKDLQVALSKARKEMQGLDRDSAQYATKKKNFELIRNEVDKVNGSLKTQGGMFSNLSGGFNKYFGMVTAGLASLTGVVMGLKSSIQDAFDFESKLAELSALTGLEGQGLDWLGDKAKELSTSITSDGVRITKSATEIIDAFKLMGSAKPELLENKEALAQVTTEALKLAEAAKMDTSLAVESLANVMNQFGASAEEASRYINVLAAGSKAGAADVDSIAKSIVKFGPAADMANISVEQSVGLIEALAEKGVKGEIAGTQLKTMLLKLQQGADEFNPKVVGLNTALDNLSKANLSATEMTKMFGMEAFTAGAILINNADRVEHFTTAVTGSNVAIEQANKNTSTNQALLDQQKNKIKNVSIELGEKLAPVMTGTLGLFTKFMKILLSTIDVYGKHSRLINTTIVLLIGYGIAAKSAAIAAWLKNSAIVANIKSISLENIQLKLQTVWTTAVRSATLLLAAGKALLTGNITRATAAMKLFRQTTNTNPWLALATAILAVGIAIYQLTKRKNDYVAQGTNIISQYQKETTEANKLFLAIKNTATGTQERANAIKAVNDRYGKYVGHLLDEKAGLKDVLAYQKLVNEALMKNIAIKAQKEQIDKALQEGQEQIQKEFDNIISKIQNQRGAGVAASAASDLGKVLSNIIDNPDGASGELDFRNKFGLNPSEFVRDMNKIRDAVRKQNADMSRVNIFFDNYIKNLRGIIQTGEELPIDNLDQTSSGGSSDSSDSDKKAKEWTLESDADFLNKRLELKKEYNRGDIKTQEDYNAELLWLELETLQERYIAKKDSNETLAKIEEQLIEKQITYNERLQEKRKKEADTDKKTRTDYINSLQSDYDHQLRLFRLKNAEELAEVTTLEQAKAKLSATMSKQELSKVDNLYDAKQLLAKQNQSDEEKMAENHAKNLLAIFKELAESGELEGLNISNKMLSDEEMKELQEKILKLKEDLAKMANSDKKEEKPESKVKALGVNNVDIFGFSPEDWKQLFINLEAGKVGVGEIAMAANSLIDVWKTYNEMVANGENKQLKLYQKNQDDRKAALDRRLEQGRVSQVFYDNAIRSIDDQTDARKDAIMKKQAKRERDVALLSAIVNTSAAAVKALAIMPPQLGIALAAMIALAGGVQIAKIASAELPGAEDGGFVMNVTRAQDGKKFRAVNDPKKRGFINKPTILTGEENKPEYVIPNDGLKNPSIRRLVNMLEIARQTGSLTSINLDAVQSVSGMQTGGYTSTMTKPQSDYNTTSTNSNNNQLNSDTMQLNILSNVMQKLISKLDEPIHAYTTIKGEGGLENKQKEYDQLIKNARL